MPRKFVVFICLFNLLLALGVLWATLKPRQSYAPHSRNLAANANHPEHGSAELWKLAVTASSHREAFSHLRQIHDEDPEWANLRTHIASLSQGELPEFQQWHFNQAVMQAFGQGSDNLDALAVVATNANMPLTLRDTAARSYIENCLRLDKPDSAYSLIDQLYSEPNALGATGLLAESYLLDQESHRKSREQALLTRIRRTLNDRNAPEALHTAALNTLAHHPEAVDANALQDLYHSADSDALRVLILKLVLQLKLPPKDTAWVQSLNAEIIQQEQLIQLIISQK